MTERPNYDAPVWLTLAEAADWLRVSPRTVQRYVADGLLTPLRTPGGHPRFRMADVEAALVTAGPDRASA